MNKVIVSMTSYPKRITNVSWSIFFLLKKQTRTPDEIHIWLSLEEFPNKIQSLPPELQLIVSAESRVVVHWLQKNTYVHKRHEYFKIANDSDCVFFIDDDVRYADNLIESVMSIHDKYKNCIICYNRYPEHIYKGKHIIYNKAPSYTIPIVNKTRWCGQSMIPAYLYPKECLSDENQEIRNKTSPISDECWFQPWVVYKDIPLYHLHYGWGTDIDTNICKNKGLVSWSHQVEANGLERRDNWLFSVLTAIPKFLEKYKRLFNYG